MQSWKFINWLNLKSFDSRYSLNWSVIREKGTKKEGTQLISYSTTKMLLTQTWQVMHGLYFSTRTPYTVVRSHTKSRKSCLKVKHTNVLVAEKTEALQNAAERATCLPFLFQQLTRRFLYLAIVPAFFCFWLRLIIYTSSCLWKFNSLSVLIARVATDVTIICISTHSGLHHQMTITVFIDTARIPLPFQVALISITVLSNQRLLWHITLVAGFVIFIHTFDISHLESCITRLGTLAPLTVKPFRGARP